jgi:hypothetical protein
MREECRLMVLENRVLRRIFGPRRGKVTGEWRKLHNEDLSDLYSSVFVSLCYEIVQNSQLQGSWVL